MIITKIITIIFMIAVITWGTTTDPEVGGDDEAADSGLAVIGEYF